ncbi:MAG: inositol monophosphatase family protein [Patescibacteria group bacterium]
MHVLLSRYCAGLTPQLIGLGGKEIVRRAIEAIRRERRTFETTRKADKGDKPDFLTSADREAQTIYVKLIKECFPHFGIIAEEDELSIPCTIGGVNAYFTVDPLDGTKAFIRRQSHGIGTMLSLVVDDEIVAAFVGDVMTGEIYYYRPDSDKVHRLFGFNEAEQLVIDEELLLAEQYLLLRDLPDRCGPIVQDMCKQSRNLRSNGLFKDVEVSGGSIGISFARMWKGEVGGVVLGPTSETPWDACPIWGISEKLGFVFIELAKPLETFVPKPISRVTKRTSELLVIHGSRVPEWRSWWKITGGKVDPDPMD